MSRSARDSSATRALLARVEARATGKLAVDADAGEIAVHLLTGEILAATSADDPRQLVRMAVLRELVAESQASELEDRIERGHNVFGDLLDAAPGPELDAILRERFWQNLCAFVSSVSTPRFLEQRAVFVENIQMGHETRALVDEVCAACDRAATLDPDELGGMRPGRVTPPPETREIELESALPPSPDRASDSGGEGPSHHDIDPPGDDGVDSAPWSLANWLETSSSVTSDEDLDFFSDHDIDRSAGGDGAFSTRSHHRDLVELAEVGAPSASDELLEADDAPAVRFGAPLLSEHDALSKLEVANQVLSAVAQAFDGAEGAGRGRAVVQLLVDGGPSRYAALLQDLQVSEVGALPGDGVLRNLYARPSTEHRQLLHSTLTDIIERALSSAADDLPEESFDHVLESVAGYRQRLGL